MLNVVISLKALPGVRAEGALAKTNLQHVVVKQTLCVVLGCFWPLHFDSSCCSGVTTEADACCHDLCENQDSFVGCSPGSFFSYCLHRGIWGHLCTLAEEKSLFPHLPQLYLCSAWSTELHPKCLYQAHLGSVSLC